MVVLEGWAWKYSDMSQHDVVTLVSLQSWLKDLLAPAQWYLAHNKLPPPLGPPYDPRYSPTLGS